MKLLENKTAIITGAGRGIGKSIAEVFANHGASVIITDIVINEQVEKFISELQSKGIKANCYKSDASSFTDCTDLLEKIEKEFSTIDILVNNAGITRDNLLMRMSEENWDDVLRVNLKSVFNMTKAIQKTMMKQRFGSIINISSVVGISGNPGQSNYSASKAGMLGFTKSIAKELGSRNIRCNAVAPGFIETEMTANLTEEVKKDWITGIPLKRSGTVEDVANVCVFLGSDLSKYVTGQVIPVCGGMQI